MTTAIGKFDEMENKSIRMKFPSKLKGQHFEQCLSQGINYGQNLGRDEVQSQVVCIITMTQCGSSVYLLLVNTTELHFNPFPVITCLT